MAKLNKHAEILDQLHTIVKKQAEAQSSVIGTPGADTKPGQPSESTEKVDKNAVKPEDNKNGFKQEPSKEEAGKVVSDTAVKTSGEKIDLSKVSNDILDLLKKATADKAASEEAQKNVSGTPGADTKPSSPTESTEHVDQNAVKPEDNKNGFKQEPSKEEAGKTVSDSSVKASSDTDYASKIASYNLGASLIYDLVKSGMTTKTAADVALVKEAGRRDMDLIINQLAEQLKYSSTQQPEQPEVEKTAADAAYEEAVYAEQEKIAAETAEQAGAAYFDEVYKNASDAVMAEKVAALEAKLAAVEQEKSAEQLEKEAADQAEAQAQWEADLITKIATAVTSNVEQKLKSEPAKA